VPLGPGEPLVLTSTVESVALLALVLRRGARCTRRLTCATRTYHSLLSVLPPKKLRELTAVRPRDGELAELPRQPVRWRDLALLVARGALAQHYLSLARHFVSFLVVLARKCRGCD